jgi:AcrR family transcriptional regulator
MSIDALEGERLDPRVRRTRRMLKDALARLLAHKDFEKISVQDIAEESTLNRATFYGHYTDKTALLNCLVAERFHEAIERRRLCFDGCAGATKAMFLGICDYFAELPGDAIQKAIANAHEALIVSIVRDMVLTGILHNRSEPDPQPSSAEEILASTVAWAIYGSAREWRERACPTSVESAAETTAQLIGAMMTTLAL